MRPHPSRLLVLQHHPGSPPGLLGERLAARGAALDVVDAERGCELPGDAGEYDGLVLLGGVMNALDDAACPHFPATLALVRDLAARGRPVLGVCLGAQLVARALGARVRVGASPEFGFTPLTPTPAAALDPVVGHAGPDPVRVMQWHDDTFDLPDGAELLLSGQACRNQAFRWGRSVYAFQGHLEATRETVDAWGRARARSTGDPAVAAALGGDADQHHAQAARFGRGVADAWLDLATARG